MSTFHIIGGVRMVVHEGEVYARLIDIIDQSGSDAQIADTFGEEEQPGATLRREPKPKVVKQGRKCGACGQPGHTARTCGRTPAMVEDGPKKSMSLKQLVQEGIDAGNSFEDICMTYPNLPSAAINKAYKELTAAGAHDTLD